jgi:hypothetical protein
VLNQLLAGSTDYHSLLPDVWKQTRPEAVRVYRVDERRDQADRKQHYAPAADSPPTSDARLRPDGFVHGAGVR